MAVGCKIVKLPFLLLGVCGLFNHNMPLPVEGRSLVNYSPVNSAGGSRSGFLSHYGSSCSVVTEPQSEGVVALSPQLDRATSVAVHSPSWPAT